VTAVASSDSVGTTPGARLLDADSAQWLDELTAQGAAREAGLARLHDLLTRAAHREVRRRAPRLGIAGPELEDIAHQAASDAMLAVLAKLDGFRGESRFTTWAYAFVMFEVSAKVGRHFWRRHPTVAMDAEDWDRLPDRFGLDPADAAEWGDLVAGVRRAVDEALTPHQRRIFVALVLNHAPLDSVVVELDSNRNAIYKALFDARRKIRAFLVANALLADDTPGS
jgi:RNA polymerase sigma-70 factor, ECF subfamily